MRMLFFKKLILLVTFPIFCNAQQIGNGFLNIYQSVGMVSFLPSPGMRSLGTGTLIHKIFGKNRDSISFFIVTCRHVLPNKSQSDFIYFDIASKLSPHGFATFKIDIYDSLGRYLPGVRVDPDSNDVAAINISYLINLPQYKDLRGTAIPYEMLATQDSIKVNDIIVGDEIYFIGYPNGWYDKRNISPIVRAGIISTPPQEDFYFNDLVKAYNRNRFGEVLPDKLHGFIIDANAIGGSSGSLVFLKPQIIRFNKGYLEYSSIGGEPLILGILAYSYLDSQSIADAIRINLGGVISASSIQKTIDSFYH